MRDKIRKIVIDGVLETKDLTETIDQLFNLLVVNQQREQLAAFYEHLNDIDEPLRYGDGLKNADTFIADNCG